MDWDPELEKHISELKKTMTSPGDPSARGDRPNDKLRLYEAVDLARSIGVRNFNESSLDELWDPYEFNGDIKEFKRECWEACEDGDEQQIEILWRDIKRACEHQKRLADEALSEIEILFQNKHRGYRLDPGPSEPLIMSNGLEVSCLLRPNRILKLIRHRHKLMVIDDHFI